MTFNALPDELRDPTVHTTTFRRLLKTHFFLELSTYVYRIRGEDVMRYVTYLLTLTKDISVSLGLHARALS